MKQTLPNSEFLIGILKDGPVDYFYLNYHES